MAGCGGQAASSVDSERINAAARGGCSWIESRLATTLAVPTSLATHPLLPPPPANALARTDLQLLERRMQAAEQVEPEAQEDVLEGLQLLHRRLVVGWCPPFCCALLQRAVAVGCSHASQAEWCCVPLQTQHAVPSSLAVAVNACVLSLATSLCFPGLPCRLKAEIDRQRAPPSLRLLDELLNILDPAGSGGCYFDEAAPISGRHAHPVAVQPCCLATVDPSASWLCCCRACCRKQRADKARRVETVLEAEAALCLFVHPTLRLGLRCSPAGLTPTPAEREARRRQAAVRLRAAFAGGVTAEADVLSLAAQLSSSGGSQLADQLLADPVDPARFMAGASCWSACLPGAA